MPINITIDDILFEVWGDKTLWSPPHADGDFIEAPDDWAELARALACCDYEDVGEHTHIVGKPLHEHFIDGWDENDNPVPGGRPSGIHFALKSGMPRWGRAKSVMTGMFEGVPIVSVLEWDDPLNNVMTTREAEKHFGLAEGSVKKAAQRRKIIARKSEGTWLIRLQDAIKKWG